MNKICTWILSFCLFFSVVGCSIEKPQDEELAKILPECLLKRDAYIVEDGDESYEYYCDLVELEKPILEYDGKLFNNPHYQEYIDGLKLQKESLEYYHSNYSYYSELWDRGFDQRFNAVYELLTDEEFTVSHDYLLDVIKEYVEVRLYNQIKDSVFEYNSQENKYFMDISIQNTSKLILKDLILNISIDDKTCSYSKEVWNPKEEWELTVSLDHEIQNKNSLDVILIHIKDSGSTVIDLTDTYDTYFEEE